MRVNVLIRLLSVVCLLLVSLTTMAANPYDYGRWQRNIDRANWQVGYNSFTVCKASDNNCKSSMGSDTWDNYINAAAYNFVRFTTDGSEDSTWRNELRYANSFWRNTSKSMSFKIRFDHAYTTSDGFTVGQLHKEDGNGPPARLEILNESEYGVKWRSSPGCTSDDNNCFSEQSFSANPRNWQVNQISTGGGYVNVTVNGQTRSYYIQSGWPAEQKYYFKTGIYLQEDGAADARYRYLYW